jgi:ABC-type phosphate transport system auxiliary subunit
MARRVGSPKADVIADTVAVNALGVMTWVVVISLTGVFYLWP